MECFAKDVVSMLTVDKAQAQLTVRVDRGLSEDNMLVQHV